MEKSLMSEALLDLIYKGYTMSKEGVLYNPNGNVIKGSGVIVALRSVRLTRTLFIILNRPHNSAGQSISLIMRKSMVQSHLGTQQSLSDES